MAFIRLAYEKNGFDEIHERDDMDIIFIIKCLNREVDNKL